jgi:hypothetical protein
MQKRPRSYDRLRDYERVSRLLLETYRNTGRHVNWVQPRWEYNDLDHGFQGAVLESGYTKGGGCEPMFHLEVPGSLPPTPLPLGFRLKSLEEDNDVATDPDYRRMGWAVLP